MELIRDLKRDAYLAHTYLLKRQHKPYLASFKLTHRCNLICQQCPFVHQPIQEPSFEQVLSMIDRLYENGDRLVVFEGGEPMLWRDGERNITDVIAYARQKFLCVGITTNGTLPLSVVNDVDVLWVSIDGFADTHNRLRGAPVFDRVIANLRASRHPKLFAHITVNAENCQEIPKLVQFLSGIVRGITIQFYYPYSADDQLTLNTSARAQLIDRLLKLKQAGTPILNSGASLRALRDQYWTCVPWLVDCADPDGGIRQGCYVDGRGVKNCALCGFTPYTEASLAYQGNLEAILAGIRIFF